VRLSHFAPSLHPSLPFPLPPQRDTYKKILERDLSVIAGSESAGRTAVLNLVMQLRKACNHPYLFTGVEDRTLDPLGDHVIQNCGKMFVLGKEGGRAGGREGGRAGGREEGSKWYDKEILCFQLIFFSPFFCYYYHHNYYR